MRVPAPWPRWQVRATKYSPKSVLGAPRNKTKTRRPRLLHADAVVAIVHSYMAKPILLNKPGLNNFNDPGNKVPGEPIPGQKMEFSNVIIGPPNGPPYGPLGSIKTPSGRIKPMSLRAWGVIISHFMTASEADSASMEREMKKAKQKTRPAVSSLVVQLRKRN